jgi:predicted Fe-Mo cluster-binding NifX family protein
MKIAIPVKAGRLAPHFGHAREVAFVTIEDGEIKASETVDAPGEHGGLPRWLIAKRADVVIVGSLGQRAVDRLTEAGVEVCSGAPKLTPEELARRFLAGTLPKEMKICAHHGHGHGHGQGHGGGGCGKHHE